MAQGIVVLILIVFLFRGESGCKEKCEQGQTFLKDAKESACIKSINKTAVFIISFLHTYLHKHVDNTQTINASLQL